MLMDLFDKIETIKVLDFLMDEWDIDFSIDDIARETDLNWKSVAEVLPKIVEMGLIKYCRSIGKEKFYKINQNSDLFRGLKMVDLKISEIIGIKVAEEELKKEIKVVA
ncbi:MAG: hypothetical protein ACE5KE_12750 [Methanosarcinales archaeon]